MKHRGLVVAIAMWVAGCGQGQPQQNSSFRTLPGTGNEVVAPSPSAPHPPPPANGPDTITKRSDAKAGIDPKSAEAAKALVESYCDFLKRKQYALAHRLWSGDTLSDQQFERHWTGYGHLDGCAVEGEASLEGAAGSVYASVPIELFFDGGRVKLSAALTLRRVNDVSGSTAEQRDWHIVRSELRPVD